MFSQFNYSHQETQLVTTTCIAAASQPSFYALFSSLSSLRFSYFSCPHISSPRTNYPGFDTQYSYWDNPLSGNPGTGNNDGRLKEIRHGALYDSLPNFNYTYDKAGNVLSQITQLTSGTSDTQNFGYDHLHRLTSASGSGNISGVSGYSHSYQYAGDNGKLGNMTSYAGTTYTYSGWPTGCNPFYPAPSQALPHAVKQAGSDYHCYDKNGNMTIRTVGTTIYTQLYDVENRLTQITQNNSSTITRFSYDAAGQRTKTEIEVPGSLKTIVYYPFPGYEEEVRQSWQPCGNDCEDRGMWVTTATVKRSTYYLVGQPIATRTTDDPITGYNGLFYFLTDHLGSSNRLVQTSGTVKSGSEAYYLPFGSYRSTPPPSINPQGFTGHKHQDHVGLIYMNARFYVHYLNRFISADTIVPNPANPQSLNRYSYTLNNPINYADPDGHNPAWCNDPYDAGGGPECAPMVDFDVLKNAGKAKWDFDEMMVIWHGAARIDFMLMQHGSSFLEVYDGTVTWWKTGTYSTEDNLGWRKDKNTIYVYEHNKASVISEGTRWVGHELGHSFDSSLYPNTTDKLSYGQATIDLATSNIWHTNEDGEPEQIAGGCTPTTYTTSCYIRTSGEPMGYVDEFNMAPSPWEDFGDMFSGYVFGFANNNAGTARYDWMDSQMDAWIALAVANNNR